MHQFLCFFFNWPKISRRFHFFVLEVPYMQSQHLRTAVRMLLAYEYDEICLQQSARKTRNNRVFKLKIMVFKKI